MYLTVLYWFCFVLLVHDAVHQIHFIFKVKGERNRKIRYRKKFQKGRYKDMREYLAKIDWNNTLKNKTATECWNILKSETDCVVDKFVPLKKRETVKEETFIEGKIS